VAKKRTPLRKKSSPRRAKVAARKPIGATTVVDAQTVASIDGEIASLTKLAVQFRNDRDWKQFHNPKDMALSMCLEAAEVLELMQWKNGEALIQHLRARREDLADELSDVLYWVLAMANDFEIPIDRAFRRKLEKSALKYPISKSRGRAEKYTEL
jgi:NTP pyrophosphatase (non-canonical NTP hydrolase)